MKRRTPIWLWAGLVATGGLLAGAEPGERVWTLDDVLSRTRAQHPLFRAEEAAATQRSAEVQQLRGAWDWVFTSDPFAAYAEPVDASSFVPDDRSQIRIDAAVTRVLPDQGARVSLRAFGDSIDQSVPVVPLPGVADGGFETAASTFYQNGVFASFQLPLFRNRGGVQDRYLLEQRGFAHQVQQLQGREALEALLERVGSLYIAWAQAREQIRIGRERLGLSENQRDTLKEQHRDGLVDQVDVLRAEEDVISTRQALYLLQSELDATRMELGRLLGTTLSTSDRPDLDLYEVPPVPDEERVDVLGLRMVRGYWIGVEQARHAADAAMDENRWQLDAVFSGGMQGGDEEAEGWLTPDQPEVRVGLAVRRELGARSARAGLIRYRAAESEAGERAESARRDLAASLATTVHRLARLQGVLELDRERVVTAGMRVQEERASYQRGKSSLVFVLQAQAAEARAKESWALNAARFHRGVLRFEALSDQLLEDDSTAGATFLR